MKQKFLWQKFGDHLTFGLELCTTKESASLTLIYLVSGSTREDICEYTPMSVLSQSM